MVFLADRVTLASALLPLRRDWADAASEEPDGIFRSC